MRPRRLEIEAMGPFGAAVELDFDELAADGLFLIHGPTGAGKTSLLDGVCFALYGKVPGARGRARSDRSHHAARGVVPRARLDFDAQGGRYRVERTAAWEAPKARGTGTTPKPATAVLRRLDAGHETVLAAKPTEVDAEIERLLGLTAAQFQQVILLPQGRFERVLQANSREREELFETLFDTIDFKRATEWLEQEARRCRTRVAELRQQLGVLGDEAFRRSRDVLVGRGGPAAATSAASSASSADGGRGVAVLDRPASVVLLGGDPLDPRAVASLVAALAATVDAAEAAVERCERHEHAARAVADEARRVAELVTRRDRLQAAVAALSAAAADIDGARAALARADEAEALRTSLDDVDHRTNVVRRTHAAVASDLANAASAIEGLRVPVEPASALDLTRVPPGRQLAAVASAVAVRLEVLAGLRSTATRVTEIEAARHRAAELADDRAAAAARCRARIEQFRAELPAKLAEVQEARAAAGRLTDLAAAAATAATQAAAAAQLAVLEPEVEQARRAVEQGRTAANDAREAHLRALEQYLEGMAAHLAGRLELDAACLVCGSHEHPNPAQPASDAVSEDDVERRKAAAEEAEARRNDLGDAHRRLTNDAAALRATAGERADDPAEARQIARDAKAAHAAAAELAEALAEREDLVARVEDAVRSDTEQAAAAETAAAEEGARRDALDAQLAELRSALAEHLPPEVGLDDALASLERARDAIERVADHAAGSQEAATKLQAARERADLEVAASTFATAAEARAAMLDDAGRQRLLTTIEDHDRRRAELATHLADPALADLPDRAPDVARLVAELDRVVAERTAGTEHLALASSAHHAVADLAHRHARVAHDLVDAERHAEVHDAVADRCGGRTAPRVPLQRWVLGTYLEEVCTHANRRLATMTSGRYRLLVTRTPAKASQPAGLDLRVHDANTNQEREVSTLSGGETFQASLALALGVADSVEAHTGGVRLEALFIDEGFGTLDGEALELAMDELDGLRAGGRTVGVISHVARLRERIRLGAEVHKGDTGSTVTVGEVPLP